MYRPKLSDLPPILIDNDGNKVTTVSAWETKRRGEIYDVFADNVYGRVPNIDMDVSHTMKREETDQTIEYVVTITTKTKFGSHSFDGYVSVPKTGKPCPVVELIQFHYQTTSEFKPKLMSRGYALARFYYTDICTDDNNDFSTGLHAVVKEADGVRKPNTWGAIASWAWAASRLMDAIEEIPEIDSSKAAIVGHSRTGKASLWCGASDPRFKLVCSNESGCGGTAITRGKVGEHIKNICEGFPAGSVIPIKPLAMTKNTCRLISTCFLRSLHRVASMCRAPLMTPGPVRSRNTSLPNTAVKFTNCMVRRGLGLRNTPLSALWIRAVVLLTICAAAVISSRFTIGMNTLTMQTRC